MTNIVISLVSMVLLGVLGLVWRRRVKKEGQNEEKLERSEKTLKRVEKARNAWDRLSESERDQLLKRYGRK